MRVSPHLFAFDLRYQRLIIARSIGVVGNQKGGNCYNQYLRVQGHRPIARIERVACDALVICGRAATADLPKPSDAWPARNISVYGAGIPDELFLGNGARSYNAHVALKDVEQLRQLVQAGFAQDGADRGHPRVVPQLAIGGPLRGCNGIRIKKLAQTLWCVRNNRTEFQAIEMLSLESHTSMTKQRRP